MSQPLVSIIIPCYNAGRWLAESVASALAQTHAHTEIIVVDDGSRDDSLARARSFEPRGVRVVAQANAGASAARNHGLRLARGGFIQFLDADDLISPDKITAQLAFLEAKPAGTLATCAWGRFQADPAAAQFVDTAVFRDFAPVDFLVLAGDTGAMMHPSSWLLPRPMADQAGPWDENLTLNDDGEYFCRVLLASTGMAYCAEGRSYYRSSLAGSLSQQRGERARRSQFRSIELITQQLLAAEDSPRTRQAAANYYQRFIHDFFPAPADLMQLAAGRVAGLGGTTLATPPMGRHTRWLARLLGWKNVWRLKYLLGR
ncbi:MAG: glycosyltransferase family A protein [Lacunisphaera sp.]|nr:glycosyltransferase family A protein [Lacunisphaera sp.]